jgi:hypothetical protein
VDPSRRSLRLPLLPPLGPGASRWANEMLEAVALLLLPSAAVSTEPSRLCWRL